MKSTQLIALAAMVGTCTFAAAQNKPDHPDGPKREIPPALLEKFDADHDGKLSKEESKAMRMEVKATMEKRRAEMLAKYDKDADGKLSEEEKATMKADMEAKRAALLEKYDADKNGKLDPKEVEAARAAGEELPPMMGHGPGGRGGKGGPPPAPSL